MKFEGAIPISPTPFNQEEAIHYQRVAPLIDFAFEPGATAVGVPTFGGEFYKLSDKPGFGVELNYDKLGPFRV